QEQDEIFRFEKFNYPSKLSKAEKAKTEKSRTVRLAKIPAEIENSDIRKEMSKYGNIENFITFFDNPYRTAHIVYKDEASAEHFIENWSLSIKKESISVTPLMLTKEHREKRKEFGMKLGGLPPNTKPFDLRELIEELRIKHIHIPRNSYNNKPRRE